MDSALGGVLRASPSGPPAQTPLGVGCVPRPSHEHKRPAPWLRVRSFPTTNNPAGTTTSADFSTASNTLTSATVPSHPANTTTVTEHPGTPAETSTSKASNLHRTPTASTPRPLDDIGLRLSEQTRPDRTAFYAIPVRWVTTSPPASSPPSLTTKQLPSTCGWCHQPPQGTHTPQLLAMSRTLAGGVHAPIRPRGGSDERGDRGLARGFDDNAAGPLVEQIGRGRADPLLARRSMQRREVDHVGVDPPGLVDERRARAARADQPGADLDAGAPALDPGALEDRAAERLLRPRDPTRARAGAARRSRRRRRRCRRGRSAWPRSPASPR